MHECMDVQICVCIYESMYLCILCVSIYAYLDVRFVY
jgi:hypothetical protein